MKIEDYVKCFIGPIRTERPFGIALWANRPPGHGFLMHAALSEICTHQKPHILVDDYLPMAIFRRSQEQQREINGLFFEALSGKYSVICLMSDTMSSAEYLGNVLAMLDKVTFREFVRCLPENKLTEGIGLATVSESLHTAAELFAFEQLKSFGLKTIIVPQFAQAIMSLHRNISSTPLSAIVTSSFVAGTNFERSSQKLWQLADEILVAVGNQVPKKQGVEGSEHPCI